MKPIMFRPKFFKKYTTLAKNNIPSTVLVEEIPHVDFTDELKNMCISHPIETCPNKSLLYRPANVYCTDIYYAPTRENMNLLYELLLRTDNFEIGYWLGKFSISYWASCQYNWYSKLTFDLTTEEKKRYISDAPETHLLAKIKHDEQILLTEINECFESTNIISPLINIIIEYNCSPLHLMGKLIAKLKSDIEKYI